jgi:hypothetical protein
VIVRITDADVGVTQVVNSHVCRSTMMSFRSRSRKQYQLSLTVFRVTRCFRVAFLFSNPRRYPGPL